jgi:hypothetical protein
MTAVLSPPQVRCQSKDRQAEYQVEGLKPSYQGSPSPTLLSMLTASTTSKPTICFIVEYSVLTSLSYHSGSPSSHSTITIRLLYFVLSPKEIVTFL